MRPFKTDRRRSGPVTVALVVALAGCSPAASQLPRIERYDFTGPTQVDLARLRQMAPAETEEGPLARYALARAHAEWLVLALIRDRDDDELLRRLAMDLGVEGASLDDRLTLSQTISTIDAILGEVEAAAAAGGAARSWAGEMARLLEAVGDGWEAFSPALIRSLAEISAREGPLRNAADLLALGWSRLALWAAMQRPPSERPEFLARMAGYVAPDLVEALDAGSESLLDAGVELPCGAGGRENEIDPARVGDAGAGAECDLTSLGLPAEAAEMISPELVVAAAVIGDLLDRRERLGAVASDPLVTAAVEDLARFDRQLESVLLPLPLPAPGPNLPTPPAVQGPGLWRTAGAVVSVHDNRLRVGLWPTLAVREGRALLIDGPGGFGLPGRPASDDFSGVMRSTWEAASERLGITDRTVALLLPPELGAERLVWLLRACEEAGASRIDLVVTTAAGRQASIPVDLERGAAALRTPMDRRALMVLSPDSLRVGFAEGQWRDLPDLGESIALERAAPLLGEHIAGNGSPTCIVAVSPECTVARVASLADLLAHAPRSLGGSSTGWTVLLDPDPPPAPSRVAATPADAVALHQVRLRGCYERYLRNGGTAQGRLILEISIAAGGPVSDARGVDSELGSQPNLDTCLVSEAQQIRFPENVSTPTVRIPLRFVPR